MDFEGNKNIYFVLKYFNYDYISFFISNEKEFNLFLLSKGPITCEDIDLVTIPSINILIIYIQFSNVSLIPRDCLHSKLSRITYNQP